VECHFGGEEACPLVSFEGEDKARALTDQTFSHCNTCKKLSGGAYTLNQIVPSSNLKITKGEKDLKIYEYAGASGMLLNLPTSYVQAS
jgi:hypothetical protein